MGINKKQKNNYRIIPGYDPFTVNHILCDIVTLLYLTLEKFVLTPLNNIGI